MQTLVWGLGHLYKFIYLTGLGNMSHLWVVPREWFALKCIGKWRSEGLNFSNRAWSRANLAWKVGSHFLLFAHVKWSDAEGTFRCCWQTRATSYISCQNPADPQPHRIKENIQLHFAYYSPLRKFTGRQCNFQVRSLRFATFSGGSRGKSIILLLWQDSWSAMICKMVQRTWWEVQEALVTSSIWRTEELHCSLRDIFRVKNISLLVVTRKRASSRADTCAEMTRINLDEELTVNEQDCST